MKCADELEPSKEIESIYKQAADQSNREVSDNSEDGGDLQPIWFAKSRAVAKILELDGNEAGPISVYQLASIGKDLLGEAGMKVMKYGVKRMCGDRGNVTFILMVLMKALE